MLVVYTGLPIVLAEFPDYEDTIKRLFRENETFQTLCEDYRQCSVALRYWNQSDSDDGLARREEYAALLKELKAEILQTLSECK